MSSAGEIIGSCRIVRPLAEGGMGTVYLAIQEPLGRAVALKLVTPEPEASSELSKRFDRELKLSAKLNHPCLVKVLDSGRQGDLLWLVMELVEGEELTQVIARGPMPWPRAVRIVADLAGALAFLHEQNILHRDVKPANILVAPSGDVKLVDFGLSRQVDATLLTPPGSTLGTITYIAPELLRGEEPTAAADLWSLGCVLFELLTGDHPIAQPDEDLPSFLARLMVPAVLDPRDRVPDLPDAVARVARGLLEHDPARRLAPAAAVAGLLQAQLPDPAGASGLAGTPPAARPTSRLDLVPGRSSRPPGSTRPAAQVSSPPRPGRPGRGRPGTSRPPFAPRVPGPGVRPVAGLALLLAILLAVGIGAHSRTGAPGPAMPISAAASPVPAPPSPPAVSPPAPTVPRPLWEYWRKCKQLENQLLSDRSVTPAVRALFAGSPLPLAPRAEVFLHWGRLGEWLATRVPEGSPPRYRHALQAQQDLPMFLISSREIKIAHRHPIQQTLAEAMQGIGSMPDDGGWWLTLAMVLEEDGCPHEAQRARAFGLDHVGGKLFADSPRGLWLSLVKALVERAGSDLESRWLTFAASDPTSEVPWQQLASVLPRERLDPLVLAGLSDVRCAEGATLFRGRQLLADWKGKEALRLWQDYLMRYPRAVAVRTALVDRLLSWGYLDRARRYATGLPPEGRCALAIAHLEDRERATKTGDGPWSTPDLAQMAMTDALLLIRGGWVARATQLLGDTRTDWSELVGVRTTAVELAGLGVQESWVARDCCRMASFGLSAMGPVGSWWDILAGGLATPSGGPVMSSLLQACAQGNKEGWTVLRALHESRSGQLAQSLRTLAQVGDGTGVRGFLIPLALEVFARPYWHRAITGESGLVLPTAIAGWMKEDPEIHAYIDHLVNGRLDQAARGAASRYESDDAPWVWGLTLAWSALALHRVVIFRRTDRQLGNRVAYLGHGTWVLRELDGLLRRMR